VVFDDFGFSNLVDNILLNRHAHPTMSAGAVPVDLLAHGT